MALSLLCAGALAACGAHTPEAEITLSPPAIQAPKSSEKDGVRVAASVLSDTQARRSFGVDLASRDLQVVWVRIENDSQETLWFLVAALDPDYYTPNEVAFLFRGALSQEDRARLAAFFRDNSPSLAIAPGQSTEGFVLAKRAEGGRYVNIELTGHEKLLHFGFAIPVADGYFDFEGLAPLQIYDEFERPDLGDTELRSALRDIPCCTSDSGGERLGDPLNIAIVGSVDELMSALARSGWSFTHRITPSTVGRLVEATLAGQAYPVAPVSSLYVFRRPQDIALQRARSLIAQRNHMRLWLAPFRYQGRSVWVGQVSRDIGVKVTTQSPSLTTHVIDPYVDEAREYLLQSLLHHHGVKRFGFVAGVGKSTPQQARTNLTDDPYFTDGLRLLVVLAQQPTPPTEPAISIGRNSMFEKPTASLRTMKPRFRMVRGRETLALALRPGAWLPSRPAGKDWVHKDTGQDKASAQPPRRLESQRSRCIRGALHGGFPNVMLAPSRPFTWLKYRSRSGEMPISRACREGRNPHLIQQNLYEAI